jgi:RNA recognition motif-containing protein
MIALRRLLMRMFEPFGALLDVKVNRGMIKRGQAWIIFQRLDSAKHAFKGMQLKKFEGRPMVRQLFSYAGNLLVSLWISI